MILDGTRNAARPVSRRHLRWPLRSASVLSRCGATGQHVSCSFHRPHGLLFIFRSSYWCAIGLRTCLGLGGLRSRFRPEIPVRPTLFPAASVSSPTGPLPSLAASSKGIRLDTWRHCRRHMSTRFPGPIRLGLHPFHSPLLRASRLLSLPAPTMMLRFRAFPSRVQSAIVPPAFPARPGPKATYDDQGTGTPGLTPGTKSHSEIPGSVVACAFPGHIAACRVLRRRRSQAIPMLAYAYRTLHVPE